MSIICREGSFIMKANTEHIDIYIELTKTNHVPLKYIDNNTIKVSSEVSEQIFLFMASEISYANMELHEYLDRLYTSD